MILKKAKSEPLSNPVRVTLRRWFSRLETWPRTYLKFQRYLAQSGFESELQLPTCWTTLQAQCGFTFGRVCIHRRPRFSIE